MQAIFIRHGSAEPAGSGPDAERRLLEEGRQEIRATAEALLVLNVKLQRLLTSPLLRAVESAGTVAEVHDDAEIEPADFLAPPADARAVRRRLAELNRQGLQAVALVGHTPSLEQCIGELVAGGGRVGVSMAKAGAACVELAPEDSSDAPELRWLMRREQLALLAGS